VTTEDIKNALAYFNKKLSNLKAIGLGEEDNKVYELQNIINSLHKLAKE
jgi:hypothetical protein